MYKFVLYTFYVIEGIFLFGLIACLIKQDIPLSIFCGLLLLITDMKIDIVKMKERIK